MADAIDGPHQLLCWEADESVFGVLAGKEKMLGEIGRIGGREVLGDRLGDERNQAESLTINFIRDVEAEPVDAVIGIGLDRRNEG